MLARIAQTGAQRLNLGQIYDGGLGEIIEEGIRRSVPEDVVTPVDVADALGLLPRRKKRGLRGIR